MTNNFQHIYNEAHNAGLRAAEATRPTAMVVYNADPLTGAKIGKPIEVISGGVCGFACVTLANRGFGKWMVANDYARKSSPGVMMSIRLYDQSYELKTAYAAAFAKVVNGRGIKCRWDSRID